METMRENCTGELNVMFNDYRHYRADHRPTQAQIADRERKARVERQVREWRRFKRAEAIHKAVGALIFLGMLFGFQALLYFI